MGGTGFPGGGTGFSQSRVSFCQIVVVVSYANAVFGMSQSIEAKDCCMNVACCVVAEVPSDPTKGDA